MQRRLFVLRHAKSSWQDASLADHDRPLAPRGERDLGRLRRYLSERAPAIEVVLCSSAVRATRTLDGVRPALDRDVAVHIESQLYGATPGQWLAWLRQLPADTAGVLLVGHNPSLEDLVRDLTGAGEPAALEQLASKYPTGALAELELAVAWSDVGTADGHLAALTVPRALPD